MENHPDLRDYLKDNPDVEKELMANPPTFVKSATEFSSNKGLEGPHGFSSPLAISISLQGGLNRFESMIDGRVGWWSKEAL